MRVTLPQPPTHACACNATPLHVVSPLPHIPRVGRRLSSCCSPTMAHFEEAIPVGGAAVHKHGVMWPPLFVPSLLRRPPTRVPRSMHERPRWQPRRKSIPAVNPQQGIHESATLTNIPHRHRITLPWSHASLVVLLVCMPFFLLPVSKGTHGGRPWNKRAWVLALACA